MPTTCGADTSAKLGPNLNLLGAREPATYGYDTLETVESMVKEVANASGTSALCFQSNSEGAIVDRIHAARAEGVKGIVINPGQCPQMCAMLSRSLRLDMYLSQAPTHTRRWRYGTLSSAYLYRSSSCT